MTERDIFVAALQQGTAVRASYLDEACAGNAALRRRIEKLLQLQEHAGSFLEDPLADLGIDSSLAPGKDSNTLPPDAPDEPGHFIGRYKLLQKLGEGGMGTVYVAEQEQPVRRRVALKIIKPGMDSAQVIRRFEQERQALALMDHQNIARVLDGDTTQAGRPYFVMELVKGVPITTYCDELHLAVRERLELFVSVCHAIHHAHQKGIIHRDIKPSNVLVAIQDGRPVPKVIDFGVAKALHQKLTNDTLMTEYGAVLGTLEYMSPEQAELSALDIDTRSDVYALGVLLYELLTGSTPLDRKRLKNLALAELLRRIREEEPPKPSTRLTGSDELPALAAHRRTEPRKLGDEVRGDLDWVVMKALEKDRTRRYESAAALARDVERHLQDEPVEACPPSARYRLGKFYRKHRYGVFMAAVIVAVLIGATGVSAWQAVRATAAEGRALTERDLKEQERTKAVLAAKREEEAKNQAQALAAKEKQAREKEESLRRQAETVSNLLVTVFQKLDPKAPPGNLKAQLVAQLDQAAAKLDKDFTGDPVVRARLRFTLGITQLHLGENEKAIALLVQALAERRKYLGQDHADTWHALNALATAYRAAGHYDKALPLDEKLFAKSRAELGLYNATTLASQNNLGVALHRDGQTERALLILEDALKKRRAVLGPDDPETLLTQDNLGATYLDVGRWDQALPLLKEAQEKLKAKLGPDHADVLIATGNLATGLIGARKLDEAVVLLEDVLPRLKARLGPTHTDTLSALALLGVTHIARHEPEKGLALLNEYYAAWQKRIGPESLAAPCHLGYILIQLKQPAAAEKFLRDGLALWQKKHPDHWRTFHVALLLGRSLLDQNKYAEAEPLLLQACTGLKARASQMAPAERICITDALQGLVQLYQAWNKLDEASRWNIELAAWKANDR